MGERAALRLINDYGLYTSLPCVHKQVADKYTLVKTGTWALSVGFYNVPNKTSCDDLNVLKIEATFSSCQFDAATQKCQLWSTSHPGLVQVADTMETNFYAMGEWIEYSAHHERRCRLHVLPRPRTYTRRLSQLLAIHDPAILLQ